MWTRSFSTSLRSFTSAVAGLPSLSSRTTSTLRPAICQPLSCQSSSQPPHTPLPAAAIAPLSGEMKPILIGPCAAAPPGTSTAVATNRSRIFGRRMGGLVPVRDRKLLGGEERDDLGAARRHDDLLLDPCGG